MKFKNNAFPNDRTVTQLFINGKTKKLKESYVLINFHGWSITEVRVMQASRVTVNSVKCHLSVI